VTVARGCFDLAFAGPKLDRISLTIVLAVAVAATLIPVASKINAVP
jgi:hypothetical protein